MERRQMLKCLLAGGISASLSFPAIAQQVAPRPQTGPPRVASNDATSDKLVVTTPKELEPILREWEEKTAIVTRLRGSHQRYIYDSVYGVEKRAVGEFWYEAPDKGRIDFEAPKSLPELNENKKMPDGRPYQVKADERLTWVSDGAQILQIEHEPKTYGKAEIPPAQRGENIMDSPLPFLFGVKAEKIKERYQLGLGSMHNKRISKDLVQYHIVAKPLRPEDARNWQRAEVILQVHAQWCLPSAIKLIDPAGSTETVYVFPLEGMKANDKFWIRDPFNVGLSGYKLVAQQTAPSDEPRRTGQAVRPVNQSAPLGRATLRDRSREN